jgi:hypothetical protein
MKKNKSNSGQVVLMTLLVLVIATTVGLSLMSRSTTDTAITTQVEQSSRAFNAAEAGIEQALLTGSGTVGAKTIVGGAAGVSYSVVVNDVGGGTGIYQFPQKTQRDATETLWLVNHDTDGTPIETPTYTANRISVCWSQESITPAMVVTLLYKKGSEYRVAKSAFDPITLTRGGPLNNFTSTYTANLCGSTGTFYGETIQFTNLDPTIDPTTDTLIALRLRPTYSDAKIVVDAGVNTVPKQGKNIEATGTTDTGNNRKISVYQQYRTPATLFDAAVFSQNDF